MEIDRKNVLKGPGFKELSQNAGNKVNKFRKEADFFKIGMTSNPKERSLADDYCNGGYDMMKILYETASEERVKSMEDYLINRFKKYDNCKNIGRGGIGKLKYGPPYFVYMIYKKK